MTQTLNTTYRVSEAENLPHRIGVTRASPQTVDEQILDCVSSPVFRLAFDHTILYRNLAADRLLQDDTDGSVLAVLRRAFDNSIVPNVVVQQLRIQARDYELKASIDQSGDRFLILNPLMDSHFETLKHQRLRLEKLGQSLARFVHQIRTPLSTAMLYSTSLVRSGNLSRDHNSVLGKCIYSLKFVERMTTELLQYAKGEQPATERIEVAALAENIRNLAQPQIQQHRGSLSVSCLCAERHIFGHLTPLQGAILNLISNAVLACKKTPRIRLVLTEKKRGWISIMVADNGGGIAPELMAHVCEPFQSGRPGGTGLGLAVVKTVIAQHHGRMRLVSRQGEGTRVFLHLPILTAKPELQEINSCASSTAGVSENHQ